MELVAWLDERGALRRGRTRFRNGLLSDGWIEKGEVFRDPSALDVVAAAQAESVRAAFPGATLLVGAPACGATLASFVGRHLRLPVAYVLLDDAPRWHRMHVPSPGKRAVYVDDLICTGQGARAALSFLRAAGLEVQGVSAWISRAALPGERLVTLAPPPFRTWAGEGGPDLQHDGVRE